MKQKILLFFIAMMATCYSFAQEEETTTTIDGVKYAYDTSTGIAYVKTNDHTLPAAVNILSSITVDGKEYPVTSIGKSAFYACYNMTSVIIPESITSIGDYAFHDCSKLTGISLPESITSIGTEAFYGCSAITKAFIYGAVSIKEKTFYGCSALNFIKFYKVTSIEAEAFSGCAALTSFNIPSTLKRIADKAFYGCKALSTLTIDDYNYKYKVIDNVLFSYDQTKLIYYPSARPTASYTIPATVKTLDDCSFNSCQNLTSITIPNSVTSIGKNVFPDCAKLESVTIPNSVTSIGDYAFDGCSKLATVSFQDISTLSSIGDYDFRGCTNLVSIDIPNSVTSIGYEAFYGCTNLTTVTFQSPSTLASIEGFAFGNCTKLTSFTIPSSVTSIGDLAFFGSSNLVTVFLPVKTTVAAASGNSVFFKASTDLKFYILDGTGTEANKTAYTGATNWSTFATATNTFFAYQKTVTDAGVATLYLPYDVDIPNGVKAYYCSGTDKSSYLSMKQLTGTASASTPLYLEAAAGTYTFLGNNNGTQTSTPTDMNPILKGSTKELTYVENTYLTLGQKAGDTKYGFYLYQNASKTAIPANVCHILKSEYIPDGSAKGLDISFNDTPTSISTATMGNGANAEAKIYDLQGRRVTSSHPTKGLYIVNGKKMIIK